MSAPVFISYSSKDGQIAQTLCQALEARGQKCWIAGRDVRAGENFQEAIVRALREARVMVLVFTSNANNSEEIKKELVLAGHHRVTVVPVRVEDVIPSDAFAYEFATRQWIDLFQDWELQVEQLAGQIDQILGGAAEKRAAPFPLPVKTKSHAPAKMIAAAVAAILILTAIALAFWRPWQHTAPSLVVAQTPAPAARAAAVQPAAPIAAPQPADAAKTATPPAAPPPAQTSPVQPRKKAAERPISVTSAAPAPAPAAALPAAPSPMPSPTPSSVQSPAQPSTSADPDEAAWQSASGANSRGALTQYLKDYPAGNHAQEAQLAMANLILNNPSTGKNFDGTWQTVWTCPNLGRYPGYSYQFTGQVSEGSYHGIRGVKGQPSSMVLDGKIESDGAAAFFGEVIVGSSLVGLGAARGTPSDFHALAAFENGSASGRRIEGRGCTLSFQRQ